MNLNSKQSSLWMYLIVFIMALGIAFTMSNDVIAETPIPPTTIGEAVVLIDADTKDILFAKNPDKWMHPASTTKMVTLLTAIELKGSRFDELATISPYALKG